MKARGKTHILITMKIQSNDNQQLWVKYPFKPCKWNLSTLEIDTETHMHMKNLHTTLKHKWAKSTYSQKKCTGDVFILRKIYWNCILTKYFWNLPCRVISESLHSLMPFSVVESQSNGLNIRHIVQTHRCAHTQRHHFFLCYCSEKMSVP